MSLPCTPIVERRKPHLLQGLPPGDYWWCACGRSQNPPFCDGSHRAGACLPVKFTVTARSGLLWLCGCKHTRTPPFCDGFHNQLPK